MRKKLELEQLLWSIAFTCPECEDLTIEVAPRFISQDESTFVELQCSECLRRFEVKIAGW